MLKSLLFGAGAACACAAALAAPDPNQPALRLADVIRLAESRHPGPAAAGHRAAAAAAAASQAAAWPNPELEFEAEEFGGRGARSGLDSAEYTLRLAQPFETGGKRRRRADAAATGRILAEAAAADARLQARATAREAFAAARIAEQRVAVAEDGVRLAEQALAATAERVQAGKAPALDESRAAVELSLTKAGRDAAQRAAVAARAVLASACADTNAAGWTLAGRIDAGLTESVAADDLLNAAAATPANAAWADRVRLAGQEASAAAAARYPDLTVGLGVTRYEEDSSQAAVFSLAAPLPVFDRNAGAVEAAREECRAVEQERLASWLEARAAIAEAHGRFESARVEALALQTRALGQAQEACEAAAEAYRQGRSDYLNVLDAQRTLNEMAGRHLDVLASYQQAAADLERLTGLSLNTID